MEKGNIKINGTSEYVSARYRYYELDGVVYRAYGRDRRLDKDLNASSVEIVDTPFGKLCDDFCIDCYTRLYMECSQAAGKRRTCCHNFARTLEITEESTDSSKQVVSIKGEKSHVIKQLPPTEVVDAILMFLQKARENIVSHPSGIPYSPNRSAKALEDLGGEAFDVNREQEK